MAAVTPFADPATFFVETAAPPSPAGPLESPLPVRMPPARTQRRLIQTVSFVLNPLDSSLEARRQFGDVWQVQILSRGESFVVTCHPDHIASLFKANPADAPSLTASRRCGRSSAPTRC